jgi:hypothetical protein
LCGAETKLYINGRPVCVNCDETHGETAGGPESEESKEQPKYPVPQDIRMFPS